MVSLGVTGYRLVSTYDLPHFPKWGRGFGVNFGHLKSNVFQNGGGGGYFGVNFGHLKSEVFQNGGRGWAFWSEIPERGFLENLDKNLLFEECVQECACASQTVSHTTYVETKKQGLAPLPG